MHTVAGEVELSPPFGIAFYCGESSAFLLVLFSTFPAVANPIPLSEKPVTGLFTFAVIVAIFIESICCVFVSAAISAAALVHPVGGRNSSDYIPGVCWLAALPRYPASCGRG